MFFLKTSSIKNSCGIPLFQHFICSIFQDINFKSTFHPFRALAHPLPTSVTKFSCMCENTYTHTNTHVNNRHPQKCFVPLALKMQNRETSTLCCHPSEDAFAGMSQWSASISLTVQLAFIFQQFYHLVGIFKTICQPAENECISAILHIG